MSKLNLRLSYKNACILKHALRNKISDKEEEYEERLNVTGKELKELEEERRAFASITEEIDMEMYKHNKSCKRSKKRKAFQ